jgi:hypothetical protein
MVHDDDTSPRLYYPIHGPNRPQEPHVALALIICASLPGWGPERIAAHFRHGGTSDSLRALVRRALDSAPA